MEIFDEIQLLKTKLTELKGQGKSIGFVPTMGALHQGHLSLIEKSNLENDYTVCSIFVNPIQFNNPNDLEKYPRNLDGDIEMLNAQLCDFIFAPTVTEMYPKYLPKEEFYFGYLEEVMEGKFRPGHFYGVAVVVKRLFDIVEPNKAYFGIKDFQQLTIIRELVRYSQLPIEIVACPIIREADGLAMSSRNVRLSKEQRQAAPFIYQTLLKVKKKATELPIEELKAWTISQINLNPCMKVG